MLHKMCRGIPLGNWKVATPASWAFKIVSDQCRKNEWLGVTNLSGAQVDRWYDKYLQTIPRPHSIPATAWGTESLRTEIREFINKARNIGITPNSLRDRGRKLDLEDRWGLVADVYEAWLARMRKQPLNARKEPFQLDFIGIKEKALELMGSLTGEDIPEIVIYDDFQDAEPIDLRLLLLLEELGVQIIALGNPLTCTEGFRGAQSILLSNLRDELSRRQKRNRFARRVEIFTLNSVYGMNPDILGLYNNLAESLGVSGFPGLARLQEANRSDAEQPPQVEIAIGSDSYNEESLVISAFQEEHVGNGVPWNEMAVIVRSGNTAHRFVEAFLAAGIPAATTGKTEVLAAQRITQRLLAALRWVVCGEKDTLPELVMDLLASPLVGFNTGKIQLLRGIVENLQNSAEQTDDKSIGAEAYKKYDYLSQALQKLQESLKDSKSPSLGNVLWKLWNIFGVAEHWQEVCLNERENLWRRRAVEKDLDAVMTLFKRASMWEERNPNSPLQEFLEEITSEEISSDTIAAQGVGVNAVKILTPTEAIGKTWNIVAIVGIYAGIWPNMKLRQGIFEAWRIDIANAVNEHYERLQENRNDEARLLLAAISRAKQKLLLAAIDNSDETPSEFVVKSARYLASKYRFSMDALLLPRYQTRIRNILGLVAQIRNDLEEGLADPLEQSEKIEVLAWLAQNNHILANPENWLGGAPITGQSLSPSPDSRISFSHVESILKCPLQVFLQSTGGAQAADSLSRAAMGTAVHEIMEKAQGQLRQEDARGITEKQVLEILKKIWKESYPGESGDGYSQFLMDKQIEQCLANGAKYLHWRISDPQIRGVATEQKYEYNREICGIRVFSTAKLDRVEEENSGQVNIIDFKTYDTSKAKAMANLQLGLYQLTLEENGEKIGGTFLVPLGTVEGPRKKFQVFEQGGLDSSNRFRSIPESLMSFAENPQDDVEEVESLPSSFYINPPKKDADTKQKLAYEDGITLRELVNDAMRVASRAIRDKRIAAVACARCSSCKFSSICPVAREDNDV